MKGQGFQPMEDLVISGFRMRDAGEAGGVERALQRESQEEQR